MLKQHQRKRQWANILRVKVTAVIGTHTHVQTADEQIIEDHTAYITDAGMTGPELSVLGVDTERAINKMKYHSLFILLKVKIHALLTEL